MIDFSFVPHKDYVIANWLARVEREIDEYIAINGSCSPALADKLGEVFYEVITNWNNPELLRHMDEFLRFKLKKEPTVSDLHYLAQYIKMKLMNKVTDKDLIEFKLKLLS